MVMGSDSGRRERTLKSGRMALNGASSRSRPSSTSCITAMATKIFETDAMR